jgi:alkaline phosphatase D
MPLPGTSVLPSPSSLITTRRSVLGASLTLAVGPVLDLGLPRSTADPLRLPRHPFALGVASGDPEPDGVVLWTRLAPEPLAPDGRGGMPGVDALVEWQVAEDERFRRIVRRGRTTAWARDAHSVHVEVHGLRPGREYWYRFRTGRHVSRTGVTRTAPAYGARVASLHAGVVSCAHLEHGWFTAYRRLAEDRPDLVVHLGDYLYEYRPGFETSPDGNVREHRGQETVDLAGYRVRHAQYKSDTDLQELHATAPWAVVFDDHEVADNWAGDVPREADAAFLRRRASAFRAYYEHMPLRRTSLPRGPGMQIYRRLAWGDLLTLHLLDTRQYRDDQACGDENQIDCGARLDPDRTILGADQERWLLDGLGSSTSTWDVLGQQVFFARKDNLAGAEERLTMDAWDGYDVARRRLAGGILDRQVRNPVVLTGDVHRHYASDLLTDLATDRPDPDSATFGVELTCTSVSSGGDGKDLPDSAAVELEENPQLRFAHGRRGYLATTFTREELRADFRVLPVVSRRGGEAETAASFVVEAGRPGLVPA